METKKETTKQNKRTAFVTCVLKRLEHDTGFGAALRRADNPATEYQSWEHLAGWCDLDNKHERICYATVAAGLARSKKSPNSNIGIGKVIAGCYDKGKENEAAKRRLRRLLACDAGEEAAQWVRPVLRLAKSKEIAVDFSRLLEDLLYFGPRVKERWAVEFYGKKEDDHDRNDV